MQSDASRESALFLREQLRSHGWQPADFARALSAAAGRPIGQNTSERWTRERAPIQPSWPYVQVIARALDLPFEEVRVGLGYRAPDEPSRPRADPWELDAQRRARLLQSALQRVPEHARAGVGLTIDAVLESFAGQVERAITAQD